MKKILILFLILSPIFIIAQNQIIPENIKSNNKPWTSLNANSDNFQFAIVTDRTGGHREGIFEKGVRKINLIQPEFVMSVGDLIEGYTDDIDQLDKEWEEFEGFIDQFEMPFFYVAGNHDYSNKTQAKQWREKFGAEYYHFLYKNVLFLCLNSEDGATRLVNPDIGKEQLEYIKKVLYENVDVRWTMVFLHQPLWARDHAKNWIKVEAMLAGRKHSVFTGHHHQYTLFERNRSDYFSLATTGGGSGLRGPSYGEFDHFMWVTMTESGPYYANILLDGIYDKALYTEAQLKKKDIYKTLIPVRQLPVFLKNGTIDAVEFYAFNPDNEERTVRLELSKGAYLAPLEAEIEIVLKPKEVRMIKALVSVTGKIDKHQRSLHTTTEFIGEDFVWSRNYNAVPFERVSIPFARKNISVDGNLSDWTREKKCLTGNFGKRDKNDANVDFSIFQSEDIFYISAAVKDNDVQSGFSDNPFAHDAVVLSLDARPLSQSAYNRREHESFMRGEWLALIMRPNAAEFSLAFNELLPKTVLGKGRKSKHGYEVEYAIPFEILDAFHGGPWKNLRLNISLVDVDAEDGEASFIHWQPDWKERNLGSGTFFRD